VLRLLVVAGGRRGNDAEAPALRPRISRYPRLQQRLPQLIRTDPRSALSLLQKLRWVRAWRRLQLAVVSGFAAFEPSTLLVSQLGAQMAANRGHVTCSAMMYRVLTCCTAGSSSVGPRGSGG
jgi:hypothetical protein